MHDFPDDVGVLLADNAAAMKLDARTVTRRQLCCPYMHALFACACATARRDSRRRDEPTFMPSMESM